MWPSGSVNKKVSPLTSFKLPIPDVYNYIDIKTVFIDANEARKHPKITNMHTSDTMHMMKNRDLSRNYF